MSKHCEYRMSEILIFKWPFYFWLLADGIFMVYAMIKLTLVRMSNCKTSQIIK